MKTYIGTYHQQGNTVVVQESGRERRLSPKVNIRNHSPSGFSWGYGGSGPAQLALAIMCDLYGDRIEDHPVNYQTFKFAFVANLPESKPWRATEAEVRQAVARLTDGAPR